MRPVASQSESACANCSCRAICGCAGFWPLSACPVSFPKMLEVASLLPSTCLNVRVPGPVHISCPRSNVHCRPAHVRCECLTIHCTVQKFRCMSHNHSQTHSQKGPRLLLLTAASGRRCGVASSSRLSSSAGSSCNVAGPGARPGALRTRREGTMGTRVGRGGSVGRPPLPAS
jgi:hypothetical protein